MRHVTYYGVMASRAPRTDPAQRPQGRWRAVIPLALMVLVGAGLLASGVLDRFDAHNLLNDQGSLHASIDAHPVLSRLAYTVLLTLAIATGVPGTIVIVLAGGLLFGALECTAMSSVSLVLGSLMLYAASRHAFGPGGREPPALARRLRGRFAREPVRYTFALRFVPIVPLGAMTIALAWLRCPLWLFTIATWLGGTISIAVESAVGAGVAHTLDQGNGLTSAALLNARLLLPLAAFLLLALVPVVVRAVRSQQHRQP